MTRRRVLIVPAWYPTADNPVAGIFVREQAALVAARHDVAVLYPFEPGRPVRGLWSVTEAVEDGIPTLRVRRRRLGLPGSDLALTVAGTRAALRRLRSRGAAPDVLHAHVYTAGAVGRAAAGPRTPMVVTEHLSVVARGRLTRLQRRIALFAYRRAQLIAPVSQNLARAIGGLGVCIPLRVIPNAVDTDRFQPAPEGQSGSAQPERIVLVAALIPAKGVAVAIEALARLRRVRPGVVLDIVGDGPERAALEARVAGLELGEAVHFSGRLDRDEVAVRLRASHVLVSTSEYESLPGNQLEALASGLPVVATRVGGVPDIVDEAVGALVPPGDPEALAAALADVLARRADFDPARLAARARERYGPERVAALWDEVYDGLAAGAHG